MRILFAFYKNILVLSLISSLVSCFTLWQIGDVQVIITLTFLKLATCGLLILFIHIFRSAQLYFFLNLGYSKPDLYLSLVLFDLSAWGLFILLTIPFI